MYSQSINDTGIYFKGLSNLINKILRITIYRIKFLTRLGRLSS
jgi:hypothetical protein